MLALLVRLLLVVSSLSLSGCCGIFNGFLPLPWGNPGYTVAPCLPKSAFCRFPGPIELPHHIVLLVPLRGPYRCEGLAVKAGFEYAYRSRGFLCRPERIEVMDSTCGSCIQEVYYRAICHDADFIVGPLLPWEVQQLAAGPVQLPTVTLSYLPPGHCAPVNLYQLGLPAMDPNLCGCGPIKPCFFNLGYDAYKVAIALNGFTVQTYIEGTTGILHMNDGNQVVRECKCPRTLFPNLQRMMKKYNVQSQIVDSYEDPQKLPPVTEVPAELRPTISPESDTSGDAGGAFSSTPATATGAPSNSTDDAANR